MKTKIKILVLTFLILKIFTNGVSADSTKIVYPLQKVSKLECRYAKFSELNNDCLENLDILKTKDYKKYSSKNGGYNKFTRRYTVLWGASYKYGWDVGHGGHMGVDIATSEGTPVYSIADGKVIVASWKTGFGKVVSIEHYINGKKVVSNYAHLNKFNTKVGRNVKAGEKIGEVGNTGNSTGNHLHLQIDTKTTYSPIYYDYKTCKYSYYDITEKGVCFDELGKITLDPLKFLETSGAILNDVKIVTNKNNKHKNKVSSNNNIKIKPNSSIFDKTVYIGYSYGDIREVQTIYKSLGYYKGEINGSYRDVEKSIIKYQLDKKVISSKNDDGAGRFGPKTRAQTKKDWDKFLKNGGKIATTKIIGGDNDNNENLVTVKTEKIDRRNMITREEIEKREVEEFLSRFNVELKFKNPGAAVKKGKTETIKLTVTNNRGKPFKGNMPGAMTFITNTNTIRTFPEKLYFFTDGKREIQIKGLAEGTTKLYVKIGEITVKTFDIKVYNSKKSIYPKSSKLYIPSSSTMGQITKGLAVFKDENGRSLVNIPFGSTFKLKASPGNKICIKKGNIGNIKYIYNKNCNNEDFREEITFNYNDTISGILLFDFQVLNKNANFEIINTYNNKKMVTKKVNMGLPKGLAANYKYKNEIMESIEKGITLGSIKRGYFREDWMLTETDGYEWIQNSLHLIKNEIKDKNLIAKIEKNIKELEKSKIHTSKNRDLTRGQLLALAYKYLVYNDLNKNININYKDLDDGQNLIANSIFNKNTTWRDDFGNKFFKPDDKITRGEGAFLIMSTLENSNGKLLTLK